MTTEHEHWVSMNDGIRLDTSVCIPDGSTPDGGWPGVLLVHGHGDAGSKASTLERGRRYAERGYLTVCYSVRGQGGSEGLSFHLGARELFDLQDMVDWTLHECPVHPKKLAVAGSSQGGWHSHMAAAHHPAVATVVPENIFADFAEFAVSNGCLSRWFFTRTMRRRIMTAGLQELARQWAISGEWHRLQEWVRPFSPLLFTNRIRCPVFIVHGWHDVGMWPNDVIALYNRLDVPKKLYLGGGGHDGQDNAQAEQLRQTLIDRWLDYWLKGIQNGIMDESPVTTVRRPDWRHFETGSLPLENPATLKLYLQVDGKLDSEPPQLPDTHANINNVPLDPDYSLRSAIYDDMAGVSQGLAHEVATFEGQPLAQSLEILGIPHFQLHLLCNRPYFQVHAELFDIAPDDKATLITRAHFGTQTANPGSHTTLDMAGRAIGYQVAAGHRLRLVVSNFNTTYTFPIFDPFCARLYHDNARPSLVELPLASS